MKRWFPAGNLKIPENIRCKKRNLFLFSELIKPQINKLSWYPHCTILQFPPRFYKTFPSRFYNFLHDFTKHFLHDFTISSTILQNICSTILQFPPRFYNFLHNFTISSTIFTIFSTILQFPPRYYNFLHDFTCNIVEEIVKSWSKCFVKSWSKCFIKWRVWATVTLSWTVNILLNINS